MDGQSYVGLGRMGVACRERGVSVCDEWVGSVGGGANMYAGQSGVRRGENGGGDGGRMGWVQCPPSAHPVPNAVPNQCPTQCPTAKNVFSYVRIENYSKRGNPICVSLSFADVQPNVSRGEISQHTHRELIPTTYLPTTYLPTTYLPSYPPATHIQIH